MVPPKLLIISGSRPGQGGVNEIWLRDICEIYPPDRLTVVTLGTIQSGPISSKYQWRHIEAPVQPRFWSKPLARLTYPLWSAIKLRQAAREICTLAKQCNIEVILIVLGGANSIWISTLVASYLRLPMVTLVWDPPEYLNPPHRLDIFRLEHKLLLHRFYRALAMSVRCAVMSSAMATEFSKYTETLVIHSGIPNELVQPPETVSRPVIKIGFSGSIYAKQEFQALVHSLASVGWELLGKSVSLLVASHDINLVTKAPVDIHYIGWRPQHEVIKIMSSCDVLYLPYKFDEQFSRLAKLSFPTKLSTYVAAQVPILYHGPAESSVAQFFQKYPIGLRCHSNSTQEIIECLKMLIFDKQQRQSAHDALIQAFDSEFSINQFKSTIAELIGISTDTIDSWQVGHADTQI